MLLFRSIIVQFIVIDVEELSALSEVKVFPNPADEQLFIDFNASENGILFIQMQDAMGRTVKSLQKESMNIGNDRLTLDTQSLPVSFYQLTLRNVKKRRGRTKKGVYLIFSLKFSILLTLFIYCISNKALILQLLIAYCSDFTSA